MKFPGLFVLAAALSVAPAHAAIIADQTALVPVNLGQLVYSVVRSTSFKAQTITAGQNGLLTAVDLQMRGSRGIFRFGLYDGDLANGTSTFVGSIDRSFNALALASNATSHFDVSSFGYHVTAGQVFTVLASVGSADGLFGQSLGYEDSNTLDQYGDPVIVLNAPYLGGSVNTFTPGSNTWTPNSVDRGFQTFVDVASTATAPLMPDPASAANGFQFAFQVKPGETVFVDPIVTTGYDFTLAAGGPSIASALFPTIAGDTDGFQLFALDGTALGTALSGVAFDFGVGGVRGFRLRGIDTALLANNPTAFVTGFTFTGGGNVNLTQTPNPTSYVPEPSAWAMIILGLGLSGVTQRRRRMANASIVSS